MATDTLTPVDADLVTSQALAWPDQARALRIVSRDTYERATDLLLDIKGLRGKIAETFDSHITRAHQAHKALLREKADAEAPLATAERIIKDGMLAYDQEQARIRQAEERRLAEELRQQEEARRMEEAAAMEREGLATDDPGLLYDAEALIAEPVVSVPIVLPSMTPKVAGVSYRKTWAATVDDLGKLVAHVAAHPELLHLLTPNIVGLNQMARALKSSLKLPGVRAVATRDVAAGRR